MKRILSLITVVTLLCLIALPGLGDSVIEYTDKMGNAAIKNLFSSDDVTLNKLENSSNTRGLFAATACFCLWRENIYDNSIVVQALITGNIYVGLNSTNELVILQIFNGDEVLSFITDLYGVQDCVYTKNEINSNITSEYYMSYSKAQGVFSQYWQINLSEFMVGAQAVRDL